MFRDWSQATNFVQMDHGICERMDTVFTVLTQLHDTFKAPDGSAPLSLCGDCVSKRSRLPEHFNTLLKIVSLIKYLRNHEVPRMAPISKKRDIYSLKPLLSLIDDFTCSELTS